MLLMMFRKTEKYIPVNKKKISRWQKLNLTEFKMLLNVLFDLQSIAVRYKNKLINQINK